MMSLNLRVLSMHNPSTDNYCQQKTYCLIMYLLSGCLILTLSPNLTRWQGQHLASLRADALVALTAIVIDPLVPSFFNFPLDALRQSFGFAGQFRESAQRVVSHGRQSAAVSSVPKFNSVGRE